jgi:hypothetical protein
MLLYELKRKYVFYKERDDVYSLLVSAIPVSLSKSLVSLISILAVRVD